MSYTIPLLLFVFQFTRVTFFFFLSLLNRLKFNEVDVCEHVISVLTRHNDNDFVTAAALQAASALLDRCNANQVSLVTAGLSHALCSTLMKYNSQVVPGSQNASLVVQVGCVCMVRLLSNTGVPKDQIQRRLSEDSACIALTACLDTSVESASIAEPALQGICLLADECGDNAVIFIAITTADAIARAMKYHISSESVGSIVIRETHLSSRSLNSVLFCTRYA